MSDKYLREEFDTGISKIRQEIKSRLVPHGLYGSVTNVDTGATDHVPDSSTIEITVKGKSATRTFNRDQIEHCCLRVGGEVLSGILSMVDEVSV